MKLLHDLWHDESGSIISAELVLLGTLGVVGVGVGAAAVGHSVEAELDEVALSIRSANQSYRVNGFHGCGAWTAGSGFRQQPVKKSRAELRRMIERERAAAEERLDDDARRFDDRDDRMLDERRPREDERRQERRERMRERESERRERDAEDRWDGDDVRPRREREERDVEPRSDEQNRRESFDEQT
ncbi:MAG: hypothetical protein U0992_22380 [Planctomycetaceae bacterium]